MECIIKWLDTCQRRNQERLSETISGTMRINIPLLPVLIFLSLSLLASVTVSQEKAISDADFSEDNIPESFIEKDRLLEIAGGGQKLQFLKRTRKLVGLFQKEPESYVFLIRDILSPDSQFPLEARMLVVDELLPLISSIEFKPETGRLLVRIFLNLLKLSEFEEERKRYERFLERMSSASRICFHELIMEARELLDLEKVPVECWKGVSRLPLLLVSSVRGQKTEGAGDGGYPLNFLRKELEKAALTDVERVLLKWREEKERPAIEKMKRGLAIVESRKDKEILVRASGLAGRLPENSQLWREDILLGTGRGREKKEDLFIRVEHAYTEEDWDVFLEAALEQRINSIYALAAIGAEGSDYVFEKLITGDSSERIRLAALAAVGTMKNPERRLRLLFHASYKDPSKKVRMTAKELLNSYARERGMSLINLERIHYRHLPAFEYHIPGRVHSY